MPPSLPAVQDIKYKPIKSTGTIRIGPIPSCLKT